MSDVTVNQSPDQADRTPLFRKSGTAAVPDHPALVGGQCVCGYTFFPMQRYGCEKCGSTSLTAMDLSGRGTLRAFAVVHRHNAPLPKTPYTVVTVVLDDGPVVRALLTPAVDEQLVAGRSMVTKLVSAPTREAGMRPALRFTCADAE